jgi:hypothetical protein
MTRYRFKFGARAAVALLFVSLACGAETPVANTSHRVAGEKLDSGLGELPHYRDWAKHPETRALVRLVKHVPGEKLDSGLGELPHYREWADNTGRQRGLVGFANR